MFRRKRKRKMEQAGMVQYVKHTKIPGILVTSVIALSIVLGVILGGKWQRARYDQSNHKTEITSDVLHQELEQIGELATVSYYYTNMGKFEDALKFLEHTVPFTGKSFILSYDGEIKAGIDLSKVDISVKKESEDKQVISITLPKATIASHNVDMDSVTLFDEKNSIFNGLSADDVTDFLAKQNSLMEEKAMNNGILEKASENAKRVISAFIQNVVQNQDSKMNYEFVYMESEEQ